MKYYDRTYDTTNTRNEKPLVRFNGVVHAVTTSEDPVIMNLARERHLNVFCTDRIAATIMCAPKSVDSWDLLAIRIADKLFFDVRPGSNFDHVTVAETAIDPPSEEPGHINSPEKLALEATFININFSQQVLQTVSIGFCCFWLLELFRTRFFKLQDCSRMFMIRFRWIYHLLPQY